MRLSTAEKRDFTDPELDVINVVAAFVTSLILHSMFYVISKKVTETIRSSLDINKVLNAIVKVITEELRAKGCSIRLHDPKRKELTIKAYYGLSKDYIEKGPILSEKSIAEAMEGKCVAIYDVGKDPRIQYPKEARSEGISSLLNIPLMIFNQFIGVLRLYTHNPYQFSNEEIHLMQMIGEQCALAIRDAQLYSGMKDRYDLLMSDFHQWFDDSNTTPVQRD